MVLDVGSREEFAAGLAATTSPVVDGLLSVLPAPGGAAPWLLRSGTTVRFSVALGFSSIMGGAAGIAGVVLSVVVDSVALFLSTEGELGGVAGIAGGVAGTAGVVADLVSTAGVGMLAPR